MHSRQMQRIVISAVACLWALSPIGASLATGDDVAVSVVTNGDFEAADTNNAAKPAAWFTPDGLGVQWVEHPDDPGQGRSIRMDTAVSEKAMVAQWKRTAMNDVWNIPNPAGNAIADTYGLSYYSDAIPVKSGQAYRVSVAFRGKGGAKVWVRCYGQFRGEKRRRYEAVFSCEGNRESWTTNSYAFHPTRLRPEVTEMKVMLYAYHPPGVYWFDNVRIDPITPEEYRREH